MNDYKRIIICVAICGTALAACKKSNDGASTKTSTDGNTLTGGIATPNTPAISKSQGFFMDDWQSKSFIIPNATISNNANANSAVTATVTVDVSTVISKISPYLFGNNTNPFMGQYVTEPILMNHLTNLSPKILRFPGGSLSDVYFWNSATKKPVDAPDTLLDAQGNISTSNYWFGQDNSSWTFSLDNYYKVLQQTASKGIICVNYGYARYGTSEHPDQVAAHLAADWVRYDKGRTRFWEIGNEDYGNWEAGYRIDQKKNKDGQPQYISGDLYGKHFKLFADSMRKAAADVGATIKIGGILLETPYGYDATQSSWNTGFLTQSGNTADYFIVHNYYTPYHQNSSADVILNTAAASSKSVMDYMNTLSASLQGGSKPIALTEWNIEAEGAQQKVSNIAGVHAVMVIGELIKNQFGMASRWDLANGWSGGNDHGLFNIGDEPGSSKWAPRPAFYYLYYMQRFLGDQFIASTVQGSTAIVSYASSFASGQAGAVLINTGTTDQMVAVDFKNFLPGSNYYYYTLAAGTGGDFSRKVLVNGFGATGVSGGPDNYSNLPANKGDVATGVKVYMPARAVVFLVCDKK